MNSDSRPVTLNIKTIAITCIPALIISILSTLGILNKADAFIWLFIAPFTAWYISKNYEKYWYLATIILGFIWGLFNTLVKIIFLDKYLSLNPDIAERLSSTKTSIYISLSINGLVSGFITAMILTMISLAFVKRNNRNKRRNQEQSK